MTNKEFYDLMDRQVKEELEVMLGKGREYTEGSDDKLFNFKDVAKKTGLSPLKVWQIYFLKHIASISNYVKDGIEASNESIEGRFTDARNYLALGLALVLEQKQEQTRVNQN